MFRKDAERLERPGFDLESFILKIKPFTITVPSERAAIYNKLKHEVTELQSIIGNPNVDHRLKLKAVGQLARLCSVMAGVLKDYQLDSIEEDLEQLKRQIKLQEGEEK